MSNENDFYTAGEIMTDIIHSTGNSLKDNIEKAIVFKVTSITILVIGIIAGIVCGNTYKATSIAYKYPSIKVGEEVIEVFNSSLMFYIWFGTIICALIFWGIYCHLNNQEKIIQILENKQTKSII